MKIKQNIYAMYAINLLQGMVFYAAIATLYRQQAGLSVFEITLIESISLALTVIFEVPWGIVADRIGYKKSMVICTFLFFISKIVFWQANDFSGFLLERLMLSVIISGLSGVDMSMLYLSCDEDKATKVFGYYDSLGTMGALCSAFIYSTFIKEQYKLAAFYTMIAYGLAFICSLFLIEVKEEKKETRTDFKSIIKTLKLILTNKKLLLFVLACALIREIYQTFSIFFSQLQYLRSGINDSMMGYIYMLVTIAGLVSSMAYVVEKKLGEKRMIYTFFSLCFGSCIVLAFTKNPIISVLGVVIISVSAYMLGPVESAIQNREIVIADRATALSVNAIIMDGVAIGTNLVFGKMADFSLPLAFGMGALFCLLAIILYYCYTMQK